MKDIFWKLFEKSGNIDAFMAYRDFNKDNKAENGENNNNKNNL